MSWVALPVQAHHVADSGARFKTVCKYSHTLSDDPIVYPNQPGASHLHQFFGSTVTSAHTTTFADLQVGGTTCSDPADKAAYWVPALYGNGRLVAPKTTSAYYAPNEKHAPLEVIPAGLKMVADEHSWKCGGTAGGAQATPPSSCPDNDLVLSVAFADCWDGVNLDTPDQSHVAYAVEGGAAKVCSPGWKPMAQLTIHVHHFTAARPITLSSGAASTAHADFFNGWGEARYAFLNTRCINQANRCSA